MKVQLAKRQSYWRIFGKLHISIWIDFAKKNSTFTLLPLIFKGKKMKAFSTQEKYKMENICIF